MLFPKHRAIRLKGKAMTALRRECYERDGGKCVDCGQVGDYKHGFNIAVSGWMNFNPLEMSHDKPRSLGGSDTLDNVHMRCRICHRKRDGHGQPMHF